MNNIQEELRDLELVNHFETLLGYAPQYRSFVRKRSERLRLQALLEGVMNQQLDRKTTELKRLLLDLLESELTGKPSFVLSTLLLEESFQYLSQQPEESLHFATGIKEKKLVLVDQFLPVDLEKATAVFAQASDPSLVRLYTKLERLGHTVTGVFHIHPGAGLSSNHPSSTDRDYMRRLGGRSLVFGIWSRDAILRLFIPESTALRFYGEGIKEMERNGQEIVCQLIQKSAALLGQRPRPA